MSHYVIDASVVIKWVVEEEGTRQALKILEADNVCAPDLVVAECANILWKKVQRKELSKAEADIGARILEQADLEVLPTRHLLAAATGLAIDLDHPAYDCIYLALAMERSCQLATADERFLRKVRENRRGQFSKLLVSLPEAAGAISRGET